MTTCTRLQTSTSTPSRRNATETSAASQQALDLTRYDNECLILRINQSLLVTPSQNTNVAVGRDGTRNRLFEVIEGEVALLSTYGRAQWLLDIGHALFDPIARRGRLYTHADDRMAFWADRPLDLHIWSEVTDPDENLQVKLYEYYIPDYPDIPSLLVTKWSSNRSRKSEVSRGAVISQQQLNDFVAKRDQKCVISGTCPGDVRCVTSHLIPKRFGDTTRDVVRRYVDIPGFDLRTGVMDPQLVIWAELGLDAYLTEFQLGFYRVPGTARGEYAVHHFIVAGRSSAFTISGVEIPQGHRFTLPSSLPNGEPLAVQLKELENEVFKEEDTDILKTEEDPSSPHTEDGHESQSTAGEHGSDHQTLSPVMTDLRTPAGRLSPPEGVFQWHYLQCVLKRFSTKRYRDFNGIAHMEEPTRYVDEDDDDSSPPGTPYHSYPSYRIDINWLIGEEDRMRQERLSLAGLGACKEGHVERVFD